MRPDEHKKKKSAQYRQKHGGANSSQKNTSEHKSKGEKQKTKPAKDVKKSVAVNPTSTTISDSSEEDDINLPQCIFEKKTFLRRKIVSNWDRYEIPIVEDSNEETRGTDFTQLLSLTSGAGSQFRLKDEKEWESELSATPNQYLTLDLEDLSDSLNCIPLYKRLGVDKSLFTESQLQSMEKEAEVNKQKYKLTKMQQINSSSTKHVIQILNTEEEQDLHKLMDDIDLNDSRMNTEDGFLSSANTKLSNIEPNEQLSTKTDINVPSIHKQEEELELLLLLNNSPTPDQAVSVANKENTVTQQVEESLIQTQTNCKTSKTQEVGLPEEENLEDWLDSVLDS
ncbi:cell death regulator Aven isoform X2 [Patella vulgata]|uniref:cell death regulator Aven isoform X2 n=1 Tax=Patella vulgata TaxID=6465 RepID=UPI00217FC620|nr:cell death regulator Aven isoform X2 [Patella vulgata]